MSHSILLVSGIWPPAVGGPASHMPDIGTFLARRGHRVRAVTSATGPIELADFPIQVVRQDRPVASRIVRGCEAVLQASAAADVMYACGFYSRSAFASAVTGTPLVIKLVNDPAYERARNRGLFEGTLDEFQRPTRDLQVAALKRLRDATLRRAARLIVPSNHLAEIARAWTMAALEPIVIPNPRPLLSPSSARSDLRRRLGVDRFTAVFAGRFVTEKQLPLALEALAGTHECDLVLIGDGPERSAVEGHIHRLRLGGRVRVLGARPRHEVIDWLAAGDIAVLSSASENHPHSAVEALAVGTPVVATAVGGVPEIVTDGVNGILVPAGDASSFRATLQRCVDDPRLIERLRSGVHKTPPSIDSNTAFLAIERQLRETVAANDRSARSKSAGATARRVGNDPAGDPTPLGERTLQEP